MKIISQYKEGLSQSDVDILLCCIESLAAHQTDYVTVAQVKSLLQEKSTKQVFLLVNRFLFEEQAQAALQLIVELASMGLDGVILSDYGLMFHLRQLGIQIAFLAQTDTTLTSYHDCQVLLESGFDGIVLARELTASEYRQLIAKLPLKCGLVVFGHQLMSTSKRQLLDAYGEQVDLTYESKRVYQLREKTRHAPYLIYQDYAGTHILDGRIYSIVADVLELQELGLEYCVVDGFNLSVDLVKEVAKRIKNGQLNLDDLQINETIGLYETKTSDKKVELCQVK